MANQVIMEVAIGVTIVYGIISTLLLSLKIRALERKIEEDLVPIVKEEVYKNMVERQNIHYLFEEMVALSQKMGLYDDK